MTELIEHFKVTCNRLKKAQRVVFKYVSIKISAVIKNNLFTEKMNHKRKLHKISLISQ